MPSINNLNVSDDGAAAVKDSKAVGKSKQIKESD